MVVRGGASQLARAEAERVGMRAQLTDAMREVENLSRYARDVGGFVCVCVCVCARLCARGRPASFLCFRM